jgi:hypothetical protein
VAYNPFIYGQPNTNSGKSMPVVSGDTRTNMRALRDAIVIGNEKNVSVYTIQGGGTVDEPEWFYWEKAGEEQVRAQVNWFLSRPESITFSLYTWNGSAWAYQGKLGRFVIEYNANDEMISVSRPNNVELRVYKDDYPNGAKQDIEALVLSTRLNLEVLRRFAWFGFDMNWEIEVLSDRIQRYHFGWDFYQNSDFTRNASDQVTQITHSFKHGTWSGQVTIGRQTFSYNANGTCVGASWDSSSGYPHHDEDLPESAGSSILQWCADVRNNLDALRDAIICGQLYGWDFSLSTWGSGASDEKPWCLIYTAPASQGRQLRGYPVWDSNDNPTQVDWVVYTWDGSAWAWTERIGYVNMTYDSNGNCVMTEWS